jgi:hypothetical protein
MSNSTSPQAEAEHVIQPLGMANDCSREAVAVVRVRWWRHSPSPVHNFRTAKSGYRDMPVRSVGFPVIGHAGRPRALRYSDQSDLGGVLLWSASPPTRHVCNFLRSARYMPRQVWTNMASLLIGRDHGTDELRLVSP